MMRNWNLVTVVVSVALTACYLPSDDAALLDSESRALMSGNMLSGNMLSGNMLSGNMLSGNMLSGNMLSGNSLDGGKLELNTGATDGLELSEEGRLLITYIVRCAFEDKFTLVTTVDGVNYEFPGLFGLAPAWQDGPLDTDEEERVSACLMAHVNHFEVPVPISARMDGYTDQTAGELADMTFNEGAFFGNVFDENLQKYACRSDAAPDFSVSYPNHDITAGDRLLRRCTDEDPQNPGYTLCGFEYLGSCSDLCTELGDGSYANCWTGASQSGTLYSSPMNVWLYVYDHPASAWPSLYDEVYGS